MDTLNLIAILKESKLSAEEFGQLMGVSGMTIRRWQKNNTVEVHVEVHEDGGDFFIRRAGRLGEIGPRDHP
jgi:hypothetical protein